MKEKELRLALVCYGGVSLALYEHGIVKEILSLARASRAYHAAADTNAKQAPQHTYAALEGEAVEGAEDVYFDLLKALGATLDLRIIIDVIAGSSAGGINGVTLARALAHDLSLEPLTRLWLEEADIQRLLAPEAKARMWSKWYLRPIIGPMISRLGGEGQGSTPPDLEMRLALSMFFRSRWFRPPLDGEGFTTLLLNGLEAMGTVKVPGPSLLPAGHQLDLIVTVTDFNGTARSIFVHDPPVIHEREHRAVFRFAYEHRQDSAAQSEFSDDHLPSLAFAARATASYPGAFPPVQLQEVDAVLQNRGRAWPGRTRFIERNFRHYTDSGLAPESAVLLDGSILNNKPVSEAVAAARRHRAFREVDRRIVYIDPHPYKRTAPALRTPGFFATLRGALSDLPRSEPIYEEIAAVDTYNRAVRQRRSVVQATRPQVADLVEKLTDGRLTGRVTSDDLRRWRLNGPNLLAGNRLIYNGWIRLMLGESIAFVARHAGATCGYQEGSPRVRWIESVVDAHLARLGVYASSYEFDPVEREASLPPFGIYIANFGVPYKKRRISFVIQRLNELYHQDEATSNCGFEVQELDRLKRRLYRSLDALQAYDDGRFQSEGLAAEIRRLFGGLPEVETETALGDPADFAVRRGADLAHLLDRLGDECDLVGLNEDVDAVLASPTVFGLGPDCQRELLLSYVGYLIWDVILLPMAIGDERGDPTTLEEMLVDRISPEDATSLAGGEPTLRGGSFAGFGGFFSRASRENDYLWGRLHAIDRLIDLVASTARREIAELKIDVAAFKKRAFERILQHEAGRLLQATELIGRLRTRVMEL